MLIYLPSGRRELMQMVTCMQVIGNWMCFSMEKARVCCMRPAPAAPCYLEAELCSAVKV